MEKKTYSDSREIDFSKIKLVGFVDTNQIKNALIRLNEVKVIVDELLTIKDKIELPVEIARHINGFNSNIIGFVSSIEEKIQGSSDVIARKKDNLIGQINSYCDKCFSLHTERSNKLLEVYAIAKSFLKSEEETSIIVEQFKDTINEQIAKSENLIKTLSENQALADLNKNRDEAETILNELKKKTSEQTVSDYAIVFKNNADSHKRFAEKWLKAGIIFAISFIIFLIIITSLNFLPTEIVDNSTDELIRYNFTNLVAKILIIAVIVFLMSFSFRQYSINRHQQTLNTHRQNALNSYQLFTKSIVGDDTNSRNALMIQVAKAIYENSQSTGFLNEKGQNVNSGLIEITKLIGQNSH